jgi:hypothetical protein
MSKLLRVAIVAAAIACTALHAQSERETAMTWAVLSAAVVAVVAAAVWPAPPGRDAVLSSRLETGPDPADLADF